MSESFDGWSDPATRQNDGRLGIAAPTGGVNEPAGTTSAVAILAAGSASLASSPQVAAAAGRAARTKATTRKAFMETLGASLCHVCDLRRRTWGSVQIRASAGRPEG